MATQRKIGDFFGRKRKATEEGKQDASAEIDSVIPDSEHEVEPDDETTPNRPSCSSDTLDHSRDRSKTKKLKKQKHATAFDTEWKEGRPWLIYKPSEGMYCEYCQEFNKIPFGRDKWNKTPCERLREESVKDHEVTASHRDAVGLHLQREASQFKNIGELLNKSKELSKGSFHMKSPDFQKSSHMTLFDFLLISLKCYPYSQTEKFQISGPYVFSFSHGGLRKLRCMDLFFIIK